jgi:antirestriction protein ArdC
MSWEKFDKLCEKIAEEIIFKIENEDLTFEDMWCKVGTPMNVVSHEPYQGFNSLYLGYITNHHKYIHPYYVSFKQALDHGGCVRKGESGYPIVFWKKFAKGDKKVGEDDDYEGKPGQIKLVPFHYTVFNIEQTDGCEFNMPESKIRPEINTLDACENVILSYVGGPMISNSDKNRAYYAPSLDVVNMPDQQQFTSDEYYYSVMFHELVHSTGHKSRLNRFSEIQPAAFASKDYSREELIAELGASYLSTVTGIKEQTFKNSVSYLKGWCRLFKDKPRELVTASNSAMKAVKLILGQNFI